MSQRCAVVSGSSSCQISASALSISTLPGICPNRSEWPARRPAAPANMKFALNGAIAIGTLDGANVEIREEVGAETFFLFGLTVEQVRELKLRGYRPQEVAERNASLREVLDFIGSGALAGGDQNLSVRF